MGGIFFFFLFQHRGYHGALRRTGHRHCKISRRWRVDGGQDDVTEPAMYSIAPGHMRAVEHETRA